jgi:hypothetical protein
MFVENPTFKKITANPINIVYPKDPKNKINL